MWKIPRTQSILLYLMMFASMQVATSFTFSVGEWSMAMYCFRGVTVLSRCNCADNTTACILDAMLDASKNRPIFANNNSFFFFFFFLSRQKLKFKCIELQSKKKKTRREILSKCVQFFDFIWPCWTSRPARSSIYGNPFRCECVCMC